jgi:hypothetical protein
VEYFFRLLFLLILICVIILGIVLTVKVKAPTRKICYVFLVIFSILSLSITLYSGKIKNKYTIKEETLTQAVDILIEKMPRNKEMNFHTEECTGYIEIKEKLSENNNLVKSSGKRKGENDEIIQINDSISCVADDYILTRGYFLEMSTEGYGVAKVSCDRYDIWITFSFNYNPKLEFMYWTIGSPTLFAKTKTLDMLEIANQLQEAQGNGTMR